MLPTAEHPCLYPQSDRAPTGHAGNRGAPQLHCFVPGGRSSHRGCKRGACPPPISRCLERSQVGLSSEPDAPLNQQPPAKAGGLRLQALKVHRPRVGFTTRQAQAALP